MPQVQQVGLEEMLQRYDGALSSLDDLQRHLADAHLIAPAARCSIWWQHVPQFPNGKIGLIGHFEARDEPSARGILDSACDHLKDHGCTVAVGPMDGSTWNRY